MGIFLILLILTTIGQTSLPTNVATLSLPVHHACLTRLPTSEYRSLLEALVCGAQLPSGTAADAFRKTGLLHLVVVSGSHLIWLEAAMRYTLGRRRVANFIIISMLCLFALATRLQPPLVRAGMALVLTGINVRARYGWSHMQITALSGLFSLALFPEWVTSLSLLLSWTAALALAAGSSHESIWQRQSRVYLCMLACLLPLTLPHPLSVPLNVVVGPFLAFVLFPLSAVVWLVPVCEPWAAPIFELTLRVLTTISRTIPEMATPPIRPGPLSLWLFLFALNGLWLFREIVRRRGA